MVEVREENTQRWASFIGWTTMSSLSFDFVRYQRGNLLTLECGRVLKAKFTAFNESWEEVSFFLSAFPSAWW